MKPKKCHPVPVIPPVLGASHEPMHSLGGLRIGIMPTSKSIANCDGSMQISSLPSLTNFFGTAPICVHGHTRRTLLKVVAISAIVRFAWLLQSPAFRVANALWSTHVSLGLCIQYVRHLHQPLSPVFGSSLESKLPLSHTHSIPHGSMKDYSVRSYRDSSFVDLVGSASARPDRSGS